MEKFRKGISHQMNPKLIYSIMWLAANGFFKYYHITETMIEFCAWCGKEKGGGFSIVNLPFNQYIAICDDCTEKTKR